MEQGSRVLRFELIQLHGGTTPHRRCCGMDTPGYVPLACSSHLSPGAIGCRYFVAGRLLRQTARQYDAVTVHTGCRERLCVRFSRDRAQ